MDKLFTKFWYDMLPLANSLSNIVMGVAGIAALLFIGERVWKHMSNNEPIDFYPLLRPFVIGILIVNFSSMVISPIHWVLSPIKGGTESVVNKMKTQQVNIVQAAKQKAKENREAKEKELDEKKKEMGFFESVSSTVELQIEKFVLWVQNGIASMLTSIVSFLCGIVVLLLKTCRVFFMSLLGVVGPIAFALSLFPTFGNAVGNWFAKYMGFYLWAPVISVLDMMVTKMQTLMLTQTALMDVNTISAEQDGQIWTYFIMQLVALVMYAAVPTITTWIIPNADGGQAMSGLRSAGAFVMGIAGGAIGHKLGGATKSKGKEGSGDSTKNNNNAVQK